MTEIKVTISAPEVTEALNNLAQALTSGTCAKKTPIGVAADAVPTSDTSVVAEEAPVEAPEEVKSTPPQVVLPTKATQSAQNPTTPASAPQIAPVAQSEPSVSTPAPSAPAPIVPTAAPQYTLEMLAKAGTALIDAGRMNDVMALLGKFGVEALTSLDPSMYGAMATELRNLGAQI